MASKKTHVNIQTIDHLAGEIRRKIKVSGTNGTNVRSQYFLMHQVLEDAMLSNYPQHSNSLGQ
jgi:hypothetical protein